MRQSFTFKKGQQLHLDDIYLVCGLFNELDWWEPNAIDMDDITILRDITITISAKVNNETHTK
jgi:hypothetical protein